MVIALPSTVALTVDFKVALSVLDNSRAPTALNSAFAREDILNGPIRLDTLIPETASIVISFVPALSLIDFGPTVISHVANAPRAGPPVILAPSRPS